MIKQKTIFLMLILFLGTQVLFAQEVLPLKPEEIKPRKISTIEVPKVGSLKSAIFGISSPKVTTEITVGDDPYDVETENLRVVTLKAEYEKVTLSLDFAKPLDSSRETTDYIGLNYNFDLSPYFIKVKSSYHYGLMSGPTGSTNSDLSIFQDKTRVFFLNASFYRVSKKASNERSYSYDLLNKEMFTRDSSGGFDFIQYLSVSYFDLRNRQGLSFLTSDINGIIISDLKNLKSAAIISGIGFSSHYRFFNSGFIFGGQISTGIGSGYKKLNTSSNHFFSIQVQAIVAVGWVNKKENFAIFIRDEILYDRFSKTNTQEMFNIKYSF